MPRFVVDTQMQYTKLLNSIRGFDDPAVEQALGSALGFESNGYSKQLAEALLQRSSSNGLSYLVRYFHKLDPEMQKDLLAYCCKASDVLRSAIKIDDVQVRKNVLEIISASKQPKLCYILSLLLMDENPSIREQSANVMKEMARSLLQSLKRSEIDSYDLNQFFLAIDLAFDSFASHLRTEVVRSAMYFGHVLPDSIWNKFSCEHSRFAHAAAEILIRESDPAYAGFSFRALTSPVMGKSIVKIISSTMNTQFIREWLKYAWYRFNPQVQRHLARIKEFKWISGNSRGFWELSSELQMSFIDILELTSISPGEKIEIVKSLLGTEDKAVQEYIVMTLIGMDIYEARVLLNQVISFDQSISFSHRGKSLASDYLTVYSVENEHGKISKSEESDDIADFSSDEYFAGVWKSLNQVEKHKWAKIINRHRELDNNFVAHIRSRLNSTFPAERAKALTILKQAYLVDEFYIYVSRLCKDPDPTVRSAAIRAIASHNGPEVEQKIVEALNDADLRVQANAIESLEETNPSNLLDTLESKISHGDNRIRANAIKAILKPQYIAANRALSSMLEHPDPRFRSSALWALNQAGPMIMVDKLIKIAKSDPDPDVKQQAERAVKMLVDRLARQKKGESLRAEMRETNVA